MPGIESISTDYANNEARGSAFFTIHAQVTATTTTDQLAAVVDTYLRRLASSTFAGYRTELDVRRGWNVFAIDSGDRPIANAAQIIGQARDWIALRTMLTGATVALRATVSHPSGQVDPGELTSANLADIELPERAHSVDVAAAVAAVATRFPHLAVLSWTVSAARELSQIAFVRRFPTAAELDVWRQLVADQSIAHADALRINGPVTPPVWLSEATTGTDAVDVALALAGRHLAVAATLPAPVLYTASDQISGHIGGYGVARGPLAVTVGGCTRRDPLVYRPSAAEEELIRRYEVCH